MPIFATALPGSGVRMLSGTRGQGLEVKDGIPWSSPHPSVALSAAQPSPVTSPVSPWTSRQPQSFADACPLLHAWRRTWPRRSRGGQLARPGRSRCRPHVLLADKIGVAEQALRDQLGCSMKSLQWLTHPGISACHQAASRPPRPATRARDTGWPPRSSTPGLDTQHEVHDVAQRDVVLVRSMVAAPADVQPDLLRGDIAQRVVQRVDAQLANLRYSGTLMSVWICQASGRSGSSICRTSRRR